MEWGTICISPEGPPHLKLLLCRHRLCGPVVDGHGVSGQPVVLLQLGIEQVQGCGGDRE